MPEELRPISLENLSDVIRLLNESSRGTSLEFRLDMFGFVNFSRYWNFSYKYSLVRYVGNEPAALMLNCADPQTRTAYTLYWGTLPQFRSRTVSVPLFDACCQRLRDDGYETLYGVSVSERPAQRYRFIQAYPQYLLTDMRCEQLSLPERDNTFSVRPIAAELLSQIQLPASEHQHWSQRSVFLQNAVPMVDLLGAFSGERVMAYAALSADPPHTLLDIRSPELSTSAGVELLRFIAENSPALTATNVFDPSYAHRLLQSCGFVESRRFSTLIRDLLTTTSPDRPS